MKVLVVEDDPVTQGFLVSLLTREGHEVGYATTGHGALAQVANQEPDVLLLDLYLTGGMSGREVLRRLRETFWESLPVVVLTASARAEVADLREMRNVFVLEKPVEAARLLGLLRTLARGGVR